MALHILAMVVTLLMGFVVLGGVVRWARLDQAARLIVCSMGLFFATALVTMQMVRLGMVTRMVDELPTLAGTLLTVAGLALWQPSQRQRRLVQGVAVLFAALWVWAQWLQGLDSEFRSISGPLAAMTTFAAAGITLVTRVRFGFERWTARFWFWCCVGLMLTYGTEVILDPFMAAAFRVRDDLMRLAFFWHLVASVGGYSLMTWGVWRATSPVRRQTEWGEPLPLA